MPLVAPVLRHWRSRPDERAVTVGERGVTYGGLARHAAQVATGLRSLPSTTPQRFGMAPQGRLLALAVGNSAAFAELFLGATACGHACAVLDPKWSPAQVSQILPRLRPDLLVAERPDDVMAAAARAAGVPLVCLDDGSEAGYDAWLARHADADPARDLEPTGEGTFLIGFTSGTTAVPKAFHRTRGSWRSSLDAGRSFFGLDESSHTMAPGPLAHGLTLYALAETLDAGASFHTLVKFDRTAVAASLAAGELRRLVVVPSMLAALCEAAAAAGIVLPQVRAVITAGSKLEPPLLRNVRSVLPNAEVTEYYGASELGFVAAGKPTENGDGDAVGPPFPGVEVAVFDDRSQALPVGTPGLIYVRSPLISEGYLWGVDGRGFRQEGDWASVGDIGWLDDAGCLHLVGREGGMVITGGYNVYPTEVERVLKSLEGIEEALVFGVADAFLGSVLVAVVAGPGINRLTADRVAGFCLAHLPRYKVPRRIFTTREWPLTSSGKIARKQIEEWIDHGDARLVPLPAQL